MVTFPLLLFLYVLYFLVACRLCYLLYLYLSLSFSRYPFSFMRFVIIKAAFHIVSLLSMVSCQRSLFVSTLFVCRVSFMLLIQILCIRPLFHVILLFYWRFNAILTARNIGSLVFVSLLPAPLCSFRSLYV